MDIQAEREAIAAESKELDQLRRTIVQRTARLHERRQTMFQACEHEFSPPIKGYEHEGGTCLHCGINEVYASTIKSQ